MAERGGNIGSVTMHDNGETFISPDLSSTSWDFSIKGCEKFLGVELGAETITDALRRMGFDALAEGDTMYVEVPSTRVDIMHKVDLYEDVATGYGFEKFGSKHPVTQTSGRISDVTSFSEIIRDLMIGMGFTEAMTLTLSSQKDEFELSKLPEKNVVTVLNPITEEHTCLRSSLMPSLMRILRRNKHRDLPQRLFEVGDVVVDSKKERHICGVVMHSKTSFTEVKSYAESVLRELKAEYTLRSSNYNTFIGGRGADIIVEGDVIGYFGEISPEVITDFEITHPVIMFEINLQPFIKKMAGKLF
jgi:phenylalanyl-tRNA synthetase beta chain